MCDRRVLTLSPRQSPRPTTHASRSSRTTRSSGTSACPMASMSLARVSRPRVADADTRRTTRTIPRGRSPPRGLAHHFPCRTRATLSSRGQPCRARCRLSLPVATATRNTLARRPAPRLISMHPARWWVCPPPISQHLHSIYRDRSLPYLATHCPFVQSTRASCPRRHTLTTEPECPLDRARRPMPLAPRGQWRSLYPATRARPRRRMRRVPRRTSGYWTRFAWACKERRPVMPRIIRS